MTVSVVIASGAGGEFLFRCLDSLREQAAAEEAQIIVVDRCDGATAERVRRDYPLVELVRTGKDHRPGIPELRMLGALRAQGDIVAVLEEHCVAPPGWLGTIRNSFPEGVVAVGGPILDGNFHRVRDWIVYFSEYHNYLPPWRDAARYDLNGANIAYRRSALLAHQDVLSSGYWEVVLHPLLAADGAFRAVAALGVRHTGPFDFGYYLGQRYLLSRVSGRYAARQDRASQTPGLPSGRPAFPGASAGAAGATGSAQRAVCEQAADGAASAGAGGRYLCLGRMAGLPAGAGRCAGVGRMSGAATPQLSVIVAIVSDTAGPRRDVSHLEGSLRALAQQIHPPAMEVIVPYLPRDCQASRKSGSGSRM